MTLPEEVQRSLAVRSITTPFALEAAKQLGGQADLVALFVVITGVFGMAVGEGSRAGRIVARGGNRQSL